MSKSRGSKTKSRGPYKSRRPDPTPQPFRANFVRKYRDRRHWTQEKLAEEADVSPGTVSGVESGETGFSPESLAQLSRGLGYPRGMLLDVDPDGRTDKELQEIAKLMAAGKK